MAIMAIIAAAILGTASAAMEAGRRDRTRSTIAKIHTLVMERWASYETRRVDVDQMLMQQIDVNLRDVADLAQRSKARGAMLADLRLLALRETMKYELPDRWSDVADGPNQISERLFLGRAPALAQTYFRRFNAAIDAGRGAGDTANEALERAVRFQAAECLYLTVMYATGDGEARTQFTAQEIGDVDGDGAPEFLDGWGNPIFWVRWPAGFVAESSLMTYPVDPLTDHDPFDPFRRNLGSTNQYPPLTAYPSAVQDFVEALRDTAYPVGFRLVPLIYSSGSDGLRDIYTSGDVSAAGAYLNPYTYNTSLTVDDPNLPPYRFGLPIDDPEDPDGDENWKDNIHNHLIEY